MSLIINVYFSNHGKGVLEEEKAGKGGKVVGGDSLWVLIKKTSTHQPTLLKIAFRWQEFKFIFYKISNKTCQKQQQQHPNLPSPPKKPL